MDSPPKLSVLLATVENRKTLFAILHAYLVHQSSGKPVEILVACDAKEISIGKKRQNLLEQATGEWVCYIDDDDWISPTYVDDILAALATNPDCVGFLIECTTNGGRPEKAIASMRYPQWVENRDGYAHCRSPYQKTPIRRTLALKAGFPDLKYAEDRAYSAKVVKLVKTEVFIEKILYFYRFSTAENFHEKYGMRRAVGHPAPPVEPRAPRQHDNRGGYAKRANP